VILGSEARGHMTIIFSFMTVGAFRILTKEGKGREGKGREEKRRELQTQVWENKEE
jgi:hypothetical protein